MYIFTKIYFFKYVVKIQIKVHEILRVSPQMSIIYNDFFFYDRIQW